MLINRRIREFSPANRDPLIPLLDDVSEGRRPQKVSAARQSVLRRDKRRKPVLERHPTGKPRRKLFLEMAFTRMRVMVKILSGGALRCCLWKLRPKSSANPLTTARI
jgi:hypothetical protein